MTKYTINFILKAREAYNFGNDLSQICYGIKSQYQIAYENAMDNLFKKAVFEIIKRQG